LANPRMGTPAEPATGLSLTSIETRSARECQASTAARPPQIRRMITNYA
jgi:hypothetical protein